MFKKVFLTLFLALAISAIPVFAQEQEKTKNYDFMFSLSGGSIAGQFSLAGEFLYAQEFGPGFFQIAGFTNLNGDNKESGGSLGLGVRSDEGFGFYLFADSLYSYEKLWMQLRPTVKIETSWLGLMGFYAFPLTRDTIEVNNHNIGAAKYWGGEVDLVPADWARIYGNVLSIENTYSKCSIGVEVRIWKYISLSADWNKTDAGLYSNWTNYQNFRVALNLLLGAQQQSFRPNKRIAVPVFYPILITKKEEKPEPEPFKYVKIGEVIYKRVQPVTTPDTILKPTLIIYEEGWGELSYWGYSMEKIGGKKYRVYVDDEILVNYPSIHENVKLEEHTIYVSDPQLSDGTGQTSNHWTHLEIYINGQKITRFKKGEKGGTIGLFRIDENKKIY